MVVVLLLVLASGTSITAQEPMEEQDTFLTGDTYFNHLSVHALKSVPIRQIPDSIWKQLKQQDAFWYADIAPHKNTESVAPGQNIINTSWMKTLVWVFILLTMLSTLVWFLSSIDIRLFRKPSTELQKEETIFLSEDIFSIDFEKQIRKATSNQEFRHGIRFLYLRSLKELTEKNLIDYTHEKTNRDYLNQLTGTVYCKDFYRLTQDFEYIWYGKFDLSAEQFHLIQQDFYRFKQSLAE